MNKLLPSWLRSLLPPRASVSQAERLRSGTGALLGVLIAGLASTALLGATPGAVWLIAPMGASAVLLFGLPASPLAQPWSVLGGNLVAALIGVSCARYIPVPALAAAAAIFLSIGAMFALHCLHPPSGAVALTAVLGGSQIEALGYGFVLEPVLLNSLLLLGVAVLYNKAVGRRYPHSQQAEAPHPHQTADSLPTARLGFTSEDLQAVLQAHDQVLDISIDDLEDLFLRTERHAHRRRFGETRCGDIMARDIVTVEFGSRLAEAWQLMRAHAVQALPVVDRGRHVIGIVTRSDFLRHIDPLQLPGMGARLRAFLRYTEHTHTEKPEVVGQIMSAKVKSVQDSTPIVELVPMMSDAGLHHVPVVNAERKLVGMITQTDFVAALYETSLAQLGEPAAA
ncbi:HPP family protein [Solimonas sp. K1W22B-7]|uniref:HPP family protein n=1 Tax=Solimonas sp. K1W22B-7 TaxID=2303331 RepID=UPI000E330EA4|nr:HPP family protein [Solimonas sp. K1W22B-7]AXQ27597.1 HPP family protein [Solimonas sp. K1W22B-7]